MDIIKTGSTQLSLLKPSNRATNIALQANKVLANPSANLVLPEGSKQI